MVLLAVTTEINPRAKDRSMTTRDGRTVPVVDSGLPLSLTLLISEMRSSDHHRDMENDDGPRALVVPPPPRHTDRVVQRVFN